VKEADLVEILEGEVLQMTSGKPGLRPQLILGQTESIHPIVGQAREKETRGTPANLAAAPEDKRPSSNS
jgi:hypothetical protein